MRPDARERLAALDAAAWGTGLSPANARDAWARALAALPDGPRGPLAGRPPGSVLLIGAANVFTALLPWMWQLRARRVHTVVKPATSQLVGTMAMAEAIGGVDVRVWQGGTLEAEAEALRVADAVLAFGGAEAIAAIGARAPPAAIYLGFGPRFGVAVVDTLDDPTADALALDHRLYDGRGCMSPAAVYYRDGDPARLAAAMARAAAAYPAGPPTADEAAELRARTLLARAVGRVHAPDTIELPPHFFSPVALHRAVALHRWSTAADLAPALARPELGTLAVDPRLSDLDGDAPRRCVPGAMQTPPADGTHEGVDVLRRLWAA